MKVLHVCFSDSHEGGAIGAYRLHRAMLAQNIDSKMLVYRKRRIDDSVYEMRFFSRLRIYIANLVTSKLLKLEKLHTPRFRSLNLFSTGAHKDINNFDVDIVQLHWINKNTLGIKELTKINKPVVWKLADMWAFNGATHYTLPGEKKRYLQKFTQRNRPHADRGIDFDRIVWKTKYKHWKKKKITFVCPSKWLKNTLKESALLGTYPVYNIPNPIDLKLYHPVNTTDARLLLDLPLDKKLILFGAINATSDKRKGFQILQESLKALAKVISSDAIELVIIGEPFLATKISYENGFRITHLGQLRREIDIVLAHSASDLLVLPTLADNLPNMVQEAMSCGTPCVGFDIGGMPDMIDHKINGYLCKPFESSDLVKGISWLLGQPSGQLSANARTKAEKLHSQANCTKHYLDVYREVLNKPQN